MTDVSSSKANILLIGIGNHSRRIYIPIINKLSKNLSVNLCCGIDIEDSKTINDKYLSEKKIVFPITYLKKFNAEQRLPLHISEILDKLLERYDINGVVIATDPLAHKCYAEWALEKGLNILMDKPITTRPNAVSDMKQAKGIYQDYVDLLNNYVKQQKKSETIFSINVQRRYESGFHKVFSLISEVSEKFNIPVTSIQAMHSDGVWIFPDEIVDQSCHGYFRGNGKCSHSGYHIFDIVWKFYKSGMIKSKSPDSAEVFSSFLYPSGLLTQINQSDYIQYFGKRYHDQQRRGENELFDLYKNFGENDAFSVVRLMKNSQNICNISINLLHNSFSRRSWYAPNYDDLYKGNGRVKHQYYYIQQGPFQAIQIHNYQSKDVHDKSYVEDYELGGNNHFDIYVFRNAKMFPPGEIPLKVYKVTDLDQKLDTDRIYQEVKKEEVIREFIRYILGEVKLSDTLSNITSHDMGVKIMSSVYQSAVRQRKNNNPIIKFKINSNDVK